MQVICPCCHSSISLEAIIQDDAARELQMLLVKSGSVGRYLVPYLGLFRSKARALAWDRALRLAREVMAMCDDAAILEAGLRDTVEAMRQKREQGEVRPLKNHNYLRQVLESVANRGENIPKNISISREIIPAKERTLSKRAQAMAALEDWGRE